MTTLSSSFKKSQAQYYHIVVVAYHPPDSQKPAKPQKSPSVNCSLEVKLFAKSKDEGEKIRTELSTAIGTWFLHKDKRTNMPRLKTIDKYRLYKLCKGKIVHIDDADIGSYIFSRNDK